MRIVFMGTPEFAVPALEGLISNGYGVVAVYTQPDKAAGRGRVLVESPMKKAAARHNLKVLQPVNLKSAETRAQLAELKPDAIVVAAFGQILPPSVLEIPPFGCINVHPSLLPKYRGVAPVPAAILNSEEFTGVSIMVAPVTKLVPDRLVIRMPDAFMPVAGVMAVTVGEGILLTVM